MKEWKYRERQVRSLAERKKSGSGNKKGSYSGAKRNTDARGSGGKQQLQRKNAPVKSGSRQSAYPQKKKRPQGAGWDPYSRYPDADMGYREEYSGRGGYSSSFSYAGRGQMSYDDFVRNREFFGGEEEEYTVHQHRRTGGTVKKKPQQGKNQAPKNRSGRRKAEPQRASGSYSAERNYEKRKYEEERNQKRSKEIMDERARRKRIKRHAGRAPKTMTPRKRKFKRFMTAFVIFFVVAVVSVLLSLTVFFKTEKILVTGETRYSHDEIISLSEIETGENIFLCDKSAASRKIVDALPYVAEANVGFVIPNAITIEIVEEIPSYAVRYSDGYYIIGENGRILEKTAENYYDLPIVIGTEITTNIIGNYADFTDDKITSILNELVNVLDAYDFQDVTVIDVSDTADIKFVYDDRITVVVGIPEDISYKIKTAQTIINEKLDPNNTGLIKGRLDVSMCNETKKSYFNENEIYVPQEDHLATIENTEETTAPQETQATEETSQEETTAETTEELQTEATDQTEQQTETAEPSEETTEPAA